MNSDVQNAEDQSASRTPKFIKDSVKNVITPKTIGEPVRPLDYDLINEVNADIRNTERLLEANLRIKKENDANRKNLRKLLIEFKEKRKRIILGKLGDS